MKTLLKTVVTYLFVQITVDCYSQPKIDQGNQSENHRENLSHYLSPFFEFYAEPGPPPPQYDNNKPLPDAHQLAKQKYRIFILPQLFVPVDGVRIIDDDANWVRTIPKALDSDDISATVEFVFGKNIPSHDGKLDILRRIHSSLPPAAANPFQFTPYEGDFALLPARPERVDVPILLYALPSVQQFYYDFYLSSYSFENVHCYGVNVAIIVDGDEVARKEVNFQTGLNTQGRIPISYRGRSTKILKRLKSGQFSLTGTIITRMSEYQQMSAEADLNVFKSAMVNEFRSRSDQKSSFGFSFLFLNNIKTVVSTYVTSEANRIATSSRVAGLTFILRDVQDPLLINQLESFLLPETTLDDVVKGHEREAATYRGLGNTKNAELSQNYAEALKNKDQGKQIDTLKAVASLSDGDIAAFLATGIAIGDESNTGTYQYRKLARASFNESDARYLGGLIFKTVDTLQAFSTEQCDYVKIFSDAMDEFNGDRRKAFMKLFPPPTNNFPMIGGPAVAPSSLSGHN